MSLCALLGACGPTDGIVGVSKGAAAPSFEEQFATANGLWGSDTPLDGAITTVADAQAAASDGRSATLVLPGHAEFGPNDAASPDSATALYTSRRFGFGTYRWRVAFGACAAGEEAAESVLGYFSDGQDHNGNGITDEVEIDFQFLCGSPRRAYLTVFTDYESSGAGERFRKLSRVVDFESGAVYATPAADSDAFELAPNESAPRVADLLTPGTFYELGFEWHASSIRFFLVIAGSERSLWTLSDPSRIPTLPVEIVHNIWHPPTHWFPDSGGAAFPTHDVSMQVDWFRYFEEP